MTPSPHRLQCALERLLVTAELVRESRLGVATLDVNRGLADRLGRPYCLRTTNRDLALLERLGYVQRTGYRWLAAMPLAVMREY